MALWFHRLPCQRGKLMSRLMRLRLWGGGIRGCGLLPMPRRIGLTKLATRSISSFSAIRSASDSNHLSPVLGSSTATNRLPGLSRQGSISNRAQPCDLAALRAMLRAIGITKQISYETQVICYLALRVSSDAAIRTSPFVYMGMKLS